MRSKVLLLDLLIAERPAIVAICAEKIAEISEVKDSTSESAERLSILYDGLTAAMATEDTPSGETAAMRIAQKHSAMIVARKSMQVGFTVSQVVHGYGALCQSITQFAMEHASEVITARDFQRLNYFLDVAIAETVTEFNKIERDNLAHEELERLGFLAHELRNALSNATMAHQLIKSGVVGLGGSTNRVLEKALHRMKDIIDQSLTEVRLKGKPIVDGSACRVIDLVSEVEVMAIFEANARSVPLHVAVPPNLWVLVDRHLAVSAISNLVQNAIKFTAVGTHVWVRGTTRGDRVLIEIEDQCGGLPAGKVEELFNPFVQKGVDMGGIGLGLSISRRAVSLNGGNLTARDLPDCGCVFTIDWPRLDSPSESTD